MNSNEQDSNSPVAESPLALDAEHHCGNDEPRINEEINDISPMVRGETIICKNAVTEGVIIEEDKLEAEKEDGQNKSEAKQKLS